MRKSTEQTPKTAETQSPNSRGKKTAQAIALAVLTVIGGEQIATPNIAFAGLQHAQQETAKETQKVNERTQLLQRENEILDTFKNIIQWLKTIDEHSEKAQLLLNQLYQMQVEFVAVCKRLWKKASYYEWITATTDDIFKTLKFTPNKDKMIYLCDASGCRI